MGLAKSLANIGMKSNCLAFFILLHGAIKHPLSLFVENGG